MMRGTYPNVPSSTTTGSTSNFGEGKILFELGPYDILLGRGTGPNEHPGNVRYRELVKSTMLKYSASASEGKCGHSDQKANEEEDGNTPAVSIAKQQIIQEILNDIHSFGGQFVRKLTREETRVVQQHHSSMWSSMMMESSQKNTKQKKKSRKKLIDLYVVVTNAMAVEKTKQSIRFQLHKTERNSSSMFATKKTKLICSSAAKTKKVSNQEKSGKKARNTIPTIPVAAALRDPKSMMLQTGCPTSAAATSSASDPYPRFSEASISKGRLSKPSDVPRTTSMRSDRLNTMKRSTWNNDGRSVPSSVEAAAYHRGVATTPSWVHHPYVAASGNDHYFTSSILSQERNLRQELEEARATHQILQEAVLWAEAASPVASAAYYPRGGTPSIPSAASALASLRLHRYQREAAAARRLAAAASASFGGCSLIGSDGSSFTM